MKIDELENLLLQLPYQNRARLAERLIASLEEETEIETAWYDEAERRLAELESGEEEEIPAEEVLASLRSNVSR